MCVAIDSKLGMIASFCIARMTAFEADPVILLLGDPG
jgi:hypothetical protein